MFPNELLSPDTACECENPEVSPRMNVLIPNVVMMGSMPRTTTMTPFSAPTATQTARAASDAAPGFQWCTTTSTGTSVAASPRMAEIDRSNSPTAKVTTAAMPRKTRASCEPKIVWKVPAVSNDPGSRIAKTPKSIAHTPTSA